MTAMNSSNQNFWQNIVKQTSAQRPDVGKRIKVIGGKKYLGQEGIVQKHILDKYYDVFRYASEAQAHMRDIVGREGFVVLIKPDNDQKNFWISADKVEVL